MALSGLFAQSKVGGTNLTKIKECGVVSVAQVRKIEDNVRRSIDVLNKISKSFFEGALHFIPPNEFNYEKGSCEPIVAGKFYGILELTQLLNIATVLRLYCERENNIMLWGGAQSTKTIMLSGICIFLPALLKAAWDIDPVISINLPNNINLSRSFHQELGTTFNLYKDVKLCYVKSEHEFEWGKGVVKLGYFYDCVDEALKRAGIPPLRMTDKDPQQKSQIGVQRNASRVSGFKEFLYKQKARADEQKKLTHFLLISDEHHHGLAKMGISDRFMNQGTQESATSEYFKPRRLSLTATPSEVSTQKESWTFFPTWTDERRYKGIDRHRDKYLTTLSGKRCEAPNVKIIEDEFPTLYPMVDMIARKYKSIRLKIKRIIRDRFTYKEKSNKKLANKKMQEELSNIRQNFPIQVKILEELFDEKFLKLAYNECCKRIFTVEMRIVMLRMFKTNFINEIFAKKLNDYINRIGTKENIVKYFGKNIDFGNRTLKAYLIDEYVNKNLFCVVITNSARSRMGDSYPKQCGNFIDFAVEPPTYDTMTQDAVGRASGYDKNSTCWLRRSYATWVDKQKDNGGVDRDKRASWRARADSGVTRGRPTHLRQLIFKEQ